MPDWYAAERCCAVQHDPALPADVVQLHRTRGLPARCVHRALLRVHSVRHPGHRPAVARLPTRRALSFSSQLPLSISTPLAHTRSTGGCEEDRGCCLGVQGVLMLAGLRVMSALQLSKAALLDLTGRLCMCAQHRGAETPACLPLARACVQAWRRQQPGTQAAFLTSLPALTHPVLRSTTTARCSSLESLL